MKNLTPLQLTQAQLSGSIGMIFGILFAWVFMLMNGYWYFSFIFGFTIFLQIINLIGTKQKYDGLKEMMDLETKHFESLGPKHESGVK